ncbi:5-oxoprolinase/urea amidolyase family protein [Arthrobacter sp. efr-133-TYG-118]|uniref:5-oxoprolinase subunit B/C family protein n=1 Tax=Arthrobacter sp. efr-133-TYG-118 TaxID=3040279 RepID=UPI00254FA953|nr:5-oxoprolinase/urea amidolyase family protein [Arthrobacter sp. efr-133-TYG-118]
MSLTGIRRAGPRALLVELSDLPSVLAFHSRLLAEPLPGQLDVVAAAATVLVKFGTHAEALAARTAVGQVDLDAVPRDSSRDVTIEVVYDGEDLAEVGMLTGLGPDGVVAAHTGQLWTAAFGGFAPGFTYLLGENHSLDVPRRSSPRTAVPAGSVALGGTFSAVYPRQSPGGWQLIGRTTAVLWDLERESPALVRPGDRVRYVAVREAIALTPAPPAGGEDTGPALVVDSPGLQSLVQDRGRPGLGDLGVSAAGAVDEQSTRQANRLVGNEAGAAVIENVLGGLSVRAVGDQVLAVAGAVVPLEIRDASGAPARCAAMCAPFALLDGETLSLGEPTLGARSYLAVRGGIDVHPVLGSRSSDSMSGIGPAPLSVGTRLPVGRAPLFQMVGAPEESTLRLGVASAELRITLGPRDDWFDSRALEALTGQDWITSEQSNRIGVRLRPAGNRALERNLDCGAGELPSEGTVAGALQVPPSGHPVLFLADHPVTGGYPVIAVVVPEDLPTAAQLPPGHRVLFTIVDPATLEPLEPAATGAVSEGTQP